MARRPNASDCIPLRLRRGTRKLHGRLDQVGVQLTVSHGGGESMKIRLMGAFLTVLFASAACDSMEEGFDDVGPFQVGDLLPDTHEAAQEAGFELRRWDDDGDYADLPFPAPVETWVSTAGHRLFFSSGRLFAAQLWLGDEWRNVDFESVVDRFGTSARPDPLTDWEQPDARSASPARRVRWSHQERRVRLVSCSDHQNGASCVVAVTWTTPKLEQARWEATGSADYQARYEAILDGLEIEWN